MRGSIYKLVCGLTDKIYVGSTFQEIRYRFRDHKKAYKQYLKGEEDKGIAIYPYFRKYDVKNWKIILIKEYDVCDKKELLALEQLWLNKFHKTSINVNLSFDILCGKCCHKIKKNFCRECKGISICIHNVQKHQCKNCKGSQICIHEKIRSQCKDCEGGSICIHDKRRNCCKDCNNFLCEICDIKYCSKQSLKRHNNTFH